MAFVQWLLPNPMQTFSIVVFDWNINTMATKYFIGNHVENSAMDAMARIQEQTASSTGIHVNSAEAVTARELEGDRAFWAEVERLGTLSKQELKTEGQNLAFRLHREKIESGMHGQHAAHSVLESIRESVTQARDSRAG